MAINKVVYAGNTLIDITDTTATAFDVTAGKYFYAADGTKTLGTSSSGGGSGTADYVSGTFTVSSETSVASGGTNFPGLTLPWKPDFVEIIITEDSFNAISAPTTSNRYWRVAAEKVMDDFPPIRMSASTVSQSTGDYIFYYSSACATNSDTNAPTGYAVTGTMSVVNLASYPNWQITDALKFRVARMSSATPRIPAGTYRFRAFRKGT